MPKCHYVRQAGFATLFEDPMDVVAGILHILIGQQLKQFYFVDDGIFFGIFELLDGDSDIQVLFKTEKDGGI